MNILEIVGRTNPLFNKDLSHFEEELLNKVEQSRFLVLGGAGTIGQAVTKELFKRNPKKLHVVDLSENNLAELVRDIRSSYGYIQGSFSTYALDIGSLEYDAFFKADGQYDYILNLSALKHVRSEKDPYTLMRMIDVNILNTNKTLQQAISNNIPNYFCISTDKAANPVSLMGASKRIMEHFILKYSEHINVSMARFANVAFSNGSLLAGFENRLSKQQPIVAPFDIERYFVTKEESGKLCLMACLFGKNGDIFIPKSAEEMKLTSLKDVALNYVKSKNLTPHLCESEDEARSYFQNHPESNHWPCLFVESDTSGEKEIEEFFTESETLDNNSFQELSVIKNKNEQVDVAVLDNFEKVISNFKSKMSWNKSEIVELFRTILPNLSHEEKGKSLDNKM